MFLLLVSRPQRHRWRISASSFRPILRVSLVQRYCFFVVLPRTHIAMVLFLSSLTIASDNSLFQLTENLVLKYIWSAQNISRMLCVCMSAVYLGEIEHWTAEESRAVICSWYPVYRTAVMQVQRMVDQDCNQVTLIVLCFYWKHVSDTPYARPDPVSPINKYVRKPTHPINRRHHD